MVDGLTVDDKRAVTRVHPHRWRPGESGNPKGRPPRDLSPTNWVQRLAPEKCKKTGMELLELVVRRLYKLAIGGNTFAIKLIIDRTEPVLTTTIVVNQLVMREDLNMRVGALKSGDVDRLLPKV